ncbi:diguanylate cyclase [Aliirhizobium terrae]|uniref:diguanylate cyclase n=1 Tax=Terrirhizobium terrae TaxID=2926709 RepID=UPI002578411F|nr:diguanylate cyclase [Rhizobium sp. CC-CFT758]WJH41591.1 diguanylate cyclase [Rhizobium sp. CC-CFT758]
MRISVITNFAYGATVVLTALSGAAFILSANSAERERLAVEEHRVLDNLGDELALGAEERSDEARLYVVSGEERHLRAFKSREEEERRFEAALSAFGNQELPTAEAEAIVDLERYADTLDRLEEEAIASYQRGDRDEASRILFGPEHERLQASLTEALTRLRALAATRASDLLQDARDRADVWSLVARIMLGLTAVLFLAVLYFVLRRRVALPLIQMTGIVSRLARQDYAVEVPRDRRQDEIGEMTEAIHIFRQNGLERDRLDAERRRDQMMKDLILQMMHRLQACQTQLELAEVVSLFAPQIFPQLAGQLFVMNESRTALTSFGSWLKPRHAETSFPASACWAIRRGRPHVSDFAQSDISCQHLQGLDVTGFCVPLTAQGDMIGLLYFEEREEADGRLAETSRLYLELIAENIGLAVANLQLRDRLTHLAVRDALTGLLNRRSLDDALARQSRSTDGEALACLMIDIDHFKRFNDEFGHDAGDEVMRYVAQIIADTVGDDGKVYRFGGEEFAVLAPGLGEEAAVALAEKIRAAVMEAPLAYRGRILGSITASLGVAATARSYSGPALLILADKALLEAKARGRNLSVSALELGEAVAQEGKPGDITISSEDDRAVVGDDRR